MSERRTLILAIGTTALFAAGVAWAAPSVSAGGASIAARVPRVAESDKEPLEHAAVDAPSTPLGPTCAWASALEGIQVHNRNRSAHADLHLYRSDGTLDERTAKAFMEIASSKDTGDTIEPLDPRLIKLAFRASYHFGGAPIAILSATRKNTRGKHATGEALDFSLEGVRAATLAAYLRGTPRAGVGIYTHPKTQYVHLDVRDHSYHWLDASPPGVTWRERLLKDSSQAKRDESYAEAMDLPETAR